MRQAVVSAFLLVVAGVAATTPATRAAEPPWSHATAKQVVTLVGEFRIVADDESRRSRLTLNGETVGDPTMTPLGLSEIVKGRQRDFVLVAVEGPDDTCAHQFRAIRLRTPVVVSDAFGTCQDAYRARVDGDRLEVTMPSRDGVADADGRVIRDTMFVYVNGIISQQDRRR